MPQLQQPPSFSPLPPASWEGGLDYRLLGQARQNSTDDLLDVELDRRGALRRVSGLRSIEQLTHAVNRVALHHGLEGKAEILFLAPPFLGIRRGETTIWLDAGFDTDKLRFALTNYGGTLIMSNLEETVWIRQSEQDSVEIAPEIPPARAYTTFAGRVLAGGTVLDGAYEPALLRWSGVDGYLEWEQNGAGFEPLISNTVAGEEILQFVPMSFDYLAVFCRSSIWIGRRTGLLDRPVDFAPRVTELSSVLERTIQNTPQGVVFLSTSGVQLFDGTNVRPAGEAIEAGLLPIVRGQEELYHSAYDPVERIYYLFTPTQTFTLELDTGRWLRRSLIAKSAVPVVEYSDPLTWAELSGAWSAIDGRWIDLGSEELDYKGLAFVVTSEEEDHLAELDGTSLTNLGVPLRPYALMPQLAGDHEVEALDIGTVAMDYTGQGQVQLAWDSVEEDLARVSTFTLPTKLRPYSYMKGIGTVTSSARARIFFLSGDPRIRRVVQWVQRRGRRV